MRTLLVFVALGAVGCKVGLDDVQKEFAREFTCPAERVEARERPELKPSMFDKKSTPPAEIAADPGRLAMWQADRDKSVAYDDGRNRIFEARGCGHQTLYACHRAQKGGFVMCSKRPYVDGISRW